MTSKELIKKLNTVGLTPEVVYDEDERFIELCGFDYEEHSDKEYSEYKQIKNETIDHFFNKHGIGKMEQVYRFGGSGKGDEYFFVYYFPLHDVYLRADAFYASYHGVDDWGDWYEVKPEEKTIIVYNQVKN